jgi:hypothetical protein
VFPSVNVLSLLTFSKSLSHSCIQMANVDYLLIPEAFGGLHRAGCFGELQFAKIYVECVCCRRCCLEGTSSARLFSVGDVFMLLHFSSIVSLWIR